MLLAATLPPLPEAPVVPVAPPVAPAVPLPAPPVALPAVVLPAPVGVPVELQAVNPRMVKSGKNLMFTFFPRSAGGISNTYCIAPSDEIRRENRARWHWPHCEDALFVTDLASGRNYLRKAARCPWERES